MAEHSLAVDSWMREAQEASILMEGLENKRHVDAAAESKLVELGIKLDCLESLLRNPPSKHILYDSSSL
ncbi:unnamed protein product [Linum trigynum]|uniref:Uncharacterized protein n=1 Tax=Linum trigynum TaxID=586398 RepID=A0AAV2CIM6_9ROSI